ncbi:MAG: cupin domain-containing protein [Sphingobacteriales bacterium]|nr:MAG: cupin domain-containing protein [Sphingobacteriales bacterium]
MEIFKETVDFSAHDVLRGYQGGYFKVLVSPEQTDGKMALIDISLPRGVDPPMHIHTREDETFYLLEGEITFFVGEAIIKTKAGDAVFGPRMVPHRFVVESECSRFLTLITPGHFVEYFQEFSYPIVGKPVVATPQGPPPAELIEQITNQLLVKYGVLFG